MMKADSAVSRREILRGLGAVGALTILGRGTGFTQNTKRKGDSAQPQDKVNRLNVRGGAIDVHHHHQPPDFGNIGRGGPWTPGKTLEQMDKFGISVAILSMTQFKVESTGLSAQRGNSAAVAVVTKSGTNEFHGALFEFLRNDIFNATEYFAAVDPSTGNKVKSTLKRNQFGGASADRS